MQQDEQPRQFESALIMAHKAELMDEFNATNVGLTFAEEQGFSPDPVGILQGTASHAYALALKSSVDIDNIFFWLTERAWDFFGPHVEEW